MTGDATLDELAALNGILPRYQDMQGHIRETGPETQRALLNALGIPADTDVMAREQLDAQIASRTERGAPEEIIMVSGEARELHIGAWHSWTVIDIESAQEVAHGPANETVSLPSLSSGIYTLHLQKPDRKETVRIIAAPRRLPSVEELTGSHRTWGINLALYGLKSDRNGGLGDYRDLTEMAAISREAGAAFTGVNPIHNMGFADTSFSPYSPSHRGFLNTEHIATDSLPGLDASDAFMQILKSESATMAQLRAKSDVPYSEHKALQQRILNAAFDIFEREAEAQKHAQFRAFADGSGPELKRFATFEVLSETHGADWRGWPSTSPEVPDPSRVAFHVWLQWLADMQLQEAQTRARSPEGALGLYLDLAVGPRRGGAESWCEKDSIAEGVSVGAPPDHLSPEGQNWDLAAFAPRKLQEAHYRPLQHILSNTMRRAGVIRIDHVLGLARSFLIPDNGAPGAYVAQPLEALIAVIKIEAERHNCAVIGEDLGLVPENFRESMRDHGFYGYSVLQYEDLSPEAVSHEGREQVLSCFSTHDTPTVRGFETGSDIAWWHKLGWINDHEVDDARHNRAQTVDHILSLSQPASDLQSAVLAILSQSKAAMVSIQLDDILGNTEAQNLPGTIDEHPNWRRKYQVSLEDLRHFKPFQDTAAALAPTRSVQKEDA